MRYIRFALVALLFGLSHVAQAQQTENLGKPRYAVIPPADVLLAIATRPDCPLQLENGRLLYNLNSNRFEYQYDFRNRGTKPIVDFNVEAWFANGTGGTLTNSWKETNQTLMPGQVQTDGVDEKQIVPLSQKLRDKLELRGEMRMVIVLVVREVIFTDGTIYKGAKTSEALIKYFETLNGFGDKEDN